MLEVLEGVAAVSSTVWDSWLLTSRSSVSRRTSAKESAAVMWLIRLSRRSTWVRLGSLRSMLLFTVSSWLPAGPGWVFA